MLQAPSHFCGHGHIKKFWLMQTQKESQSFDSKSTVLVSSPSSRTGNRAPMKVLDVVQRGSSTQVTTSSSYSESGAGLGKHSSVSCAESLSPPNRSWIHAAYQRKPKEVRDGTHDAAACKESNRSSPLSPIRSVACASADLASDPSVEAGSSDRSLPCSSSDLLPAIYGSSTSANLDEKRCISQLSEGNATCWAAEGDDSAEGCSNRSVAQIANEETSTERGGTLETWEIECKGPTLEDGSVVDAGYGMAAVKRPAAATPIGTTFIQSSSPPPSSDDASQQTPKSCTLCGTTKTPMWRSGPHGPKSLCNACGIRYKKYKSLPGQGGEAVVPPVLVTRYFTTRPLKRKQDGGAVPMHEAAPPHRAEMPEAGVVKADACRHQKKSKWQELVMEREQRATELLRDRPGAWRVSQGPASLKKIYGCMQSRLKNGGPSEERLKVNRVFAKDEEEAAVLLMHLSCGLAY